MRSARKGLRLLGLSIATLMSAAGARAQSPVSSRPLLTVRVDPTEFGIQDETITAVTGTSFMAISAGGEGLVVATPVDLASFSRYCATCESEGVEYFATLNVPAGAVIDFIGVNNKSDTDSILDFGLFERGRTGHAAGLVGFALPAHDWATDFAGPLNVLIPNNRDHQYVLLVEQAPSSHRQFFGGVEVWWHRTVSAAPAVATFSDVPPSDPFFQFIEALAAAGITAGCGDGKFCADAPLTRGQMAVFLSKALGLHFPD